MPKGPQGQRRPADVIGAAIKVAKIATGELTEEITGKEYARRGGLKGGPARARRLSKKRRSEIARRAARERWSK